MNQIETYGEPYVPNLSIRSNLTHDDIVNSLEFRDIEILTDNSIFEVLDARRKTSQDRKDFINDQDSTAGPGVVDNMIRNIITVRTGTFTGDNKFGINVDDLLFEQLDWANLEFMRSLIISGLDNHLPSNVTVLNVELSTNEKHDELIITIQYNIKLKDKGLQQPGPETIGNRKFNVSLNLAGSVGSNGGVI